MTSFEKNIKQRVQQWALIQVSTASELFAWIFLRKSVENYFPLGIVDNSEDNYPVLRLLKLTWASLPQLNSPEKQSRRF